MSVFIASLTLTLGCLMALLVLRARLRRGGIPENDIGRRALATPVGLVCFWGAILSGAVAITALVGFVIFR